MKYVFITFIALGLGAYLIDYKGIGRDFTPTANAKTQAPIVVELYTSQSCSSCPPADKVLAEIAQQPNIIALGCHVTYWNHLHWKDTLSLEECTKRQRAFNNFANSNRVYTPQMVVNGDQEFIGSRRGQAISILKNANPLLPIQLSQSDGNIIAHYPNVNLNSDMVIEWVGYNNRYRQDIPSGENRGRSITYSNPVQYIYYGRSQDSKSSSMMTVDQLKSDHVAVLIRDERAGKVIAAGTIKL